MDISQRWKNLIAAIGSHTAVALIFFFIGVGTCWFAYEILITQIIVPHLTGILLFSIGVIAGVVGLIAITGGE